MTKDQLDFNDMISASLLRLRIKSPFFATLALFARILAREDMATAATDGRDVFVNPDFLRSLTPAQRDGLLLHEVLHAALLHVARRGTRIPLLWNIAADIVVNGLIVAQGAFELPPGGLRDTALEHLSVEEVYYRLTKDPDRHWDVIIDLLEADGGGGMMSDAQRAEIETVWRNAMQQANAVARSLGRGDIPAGMQREFDALSVAKIDWRSYLWRYLVRTPTDFQGFDRRFIGRGLYLETLEGESIQVYVAVDTSGSIDGQTINDFLGEVQGILRAYPHVRCELYYADAAIYGPYSLTPDSQLPAPVGGGGTDFRPFFEVVQAFRDPYQETVCVYLTDGFGTFPQEPPDLATLWVVTAGGLALEQVPFGESVRLV